MFSSNMRSLTYDIGCNDNDRAVLNITFEHYAMNPNGFHVGYETFQMTYQIVDKSTLERNHKQKHNRSKFMVSLSDDEFTCIDAPPSEVCECDDNADCMCELYHSPLDSDDIDWAWQEYNAMFVEVMSKDIQWLFNGKTWEIVMNFDSEDSIDIIWSPTKE